MKNKLVAYILIFVFTATPFITHAQTPISVPMGGTLLMSHECACSGGWMMYIWDQYTHMVIPVVFQFGISRMNGNYNIYLPGTSDLGSYVTGGTCVMASTECYGSITPIGTVTPPPLPGVGTTLI